MRTDIARPIRLTDYRAPAFRVISTDLSFRLDPVATRVTAKLRFERISDGPLVLLGERLKLIAIKLNGIDLAPDTYEITAETLTLRDAPAQFQLETEVEINPQDNKTLEGLYMSSGRYCTQCEAEGFRKITYFPDRPDVLSKYTVRVEAPKAGFPHLLSNGNLIEQGDAPDAKDAADNRHYAVWEDPFNKPSYLFALVAGELDVLQDTLTTMSGRTVELKIYVDTGMSARAAYAMDALKRSMRWDEQVYGREYDLDLFMIVAVRDFNFGAMENKGLNIFNASLLLADPTTATDSDYERIESVIAHEYFHNWSGNRVTCRDWFQLCLKEGLTVYRDQGFSADGRGHAVQRIKDVKALRARQFPEDAGPLAHPVRPSSYLKIDNFYTATIYEKGAEIVGMLKTVVGPKVYRAALDHYFTTHDGTAATLEDFLKSFEAVTGDDFSNWLNWYTQAGTPRLQITQTYDAAAKTLTLNLSQSTAPTPSQPTKAVVPIPVRLGILSEDGTPQSFGFEGHSQEGLSLAEITYVLSETNAAITLTDVADAPVLSALRHFSAPVILEIEEPQSHAYARFRGDLDPFNRWEAAQKLAQNLILKHDLILTGGDVAPYAEALKATLLDGTLEPAFKALIMALPTEQGLAQDMTPVDPAAIHTRRKAVKAELSTTLYATLRDLYDAIQPPATFSPDAASAGGRALRNALLDLMMAGYGTADDVRKGELSALARAHYARADNMTDMIAALTALMSVHGEPYEAALDGFYARFKDEPLVIDKWFALQAACPNPETLARIGRLSRHADFDPKVPNRWRALVQNLASNNPAVFHGVFAPDSYGYGFVVDQILTVDEFNPMTAARLVESLSGYKRYATPYREAMRAALETIMAAPKLSKNVAELTAKALDQK